ncbi:MAG: TolC family protein [Xanthomonadaceae bacterium]|nr:TolC family protein [Xanthomonadaceae bacterium]
MLVAFFIHDHSIAAKQMTRSGEVLTLEMAIKKAMSSNWDILQTRNSLRQKQITYDNAFDTMFMPAVNFTTRLDSNFSIAQMPGSTAYNLGQAQDPTALEAQGKTQSNYTFSKGYPTTSVGVELGSYTIFNFFRDQLFYEAARLTWEREQQKLIEAERSLRFDVILSYFKNKTEQDKLEAAKRSVDISEAILELVQSKEELGQTKNTDLNSSTVDFLNAKNQFIDLDRSVQQQRWALNLLMGEPLTNVYVLKTDLEYTPLQLEADDAHKLFMENSPTVRDARVGVKTFELILSRAEKDRLPLPTISLSALSVRYGNSYWGDTKTYTASGSGNIDFVTSLNFSIPLYGPGGFLGKRTIETARINRDNADLAFQKTMMESEIGIQSLFVVIKQQEQAVGINKESIQNASKLLETLFSNFSRSGANRLELRDAINQARSIEFNYKDAILSHLERKLALAKFIGVDHLPGEFF